jgi:hypothetical protein
MFVACCLIMLRFGPQMNDPLVVYPYIAVTGLSAVTWPIFTIWTIRAAFTSIRRSNRSRKRNGS